MIAPDVRTLRDVLLARPALTSIVAASSLLVDGVSVPDNAPLADGAVVDVLPPFAGG